MSSKSNASLRTKLTRKIDRGVLKRAREIASRYTIAVEPIDGGYLGRGLEMRGVMADGKTPDACMSQTREALIGAVAVMLEEGARPPAPASAGTRQEQVNIRLTSEERALFETAAQRHGFRGLSDFLRAAGLRYTDQS